MVGVSGRSKGCNTCRQRRVKCTEEKPICNRCTKGGFTCRGYARETVWHHLTVEPSSAKSSAQSALGRLVVVESQPAACKTHARAATHSREPSLPTEVGLAAFKDDVCFAYIFSNFVLRGYGTSWLHQSAQGLLGQLAFDSVKALADMTFGRSHKSSQTEIQGRLKYGVTLRQMVERLGDGQKDNLRELVIPILLLLIHPTTLTNGPAAMFHLQAMTRILTTCGPEVFQHQPFRDAFEAARTTTVVASLVTRKRVFLDDRAWQTGPYILEPQAKASQSYLLDILGSVPGLLEDHDKVENMMQSSPSPPPSTDSADGADTNTARDAMPDVVYASFEDIVAARSDLLDSVVVKLESLFVWRLHWQVTFGSQVRSSSAKSPTRPKDTAGSRRDKLRFSRPGAAADIALYNAVLMWLLALIEELEPHRVQFIVRSCAYQAMMSMTDTEFAFTSGQATKLTGLPSFEPLNGIGSATGVQEAAMEICRVFEWQSSNHGLTTWEANFIYMFPIGLALCVFDKDPVNRDWIRTMLSTHALTRNYGVGTTIDDDNIQDGSTTCHLPSLNGNVGVETAGRPASEKGVLHRLQQFGSYLTRELSDSENPEDGPQPNLVHLLLLRSQINFSC